MHSLQKDTCYQWSPVCDLFFGGTQWAYRNCVELWLNRSVWPERFVIVVQLFSIHVQLFATPWTVTRQAYLSFTISWHLLTLVSIETVMPPNHLILCCHFLLLPSIFPSIRVFSNESVFSSAGQSIGDSASVSVLPMNIRGLFPFGLTGLTSLLSKGLSRVFSRTMIWKHQFFGAQPSLWSSPYIRASYWKNRRLDNTILCQKIDVSAFSLCY